MNQQTLSEEARSFSWLLNGFVERTTGVTDAVAVSSDGLLMAMSSSLSRASAEQLAAIISGMVSLGNGASTCFGFDGLEQVIVTMHRGFLFVSAISDGSCLGVVATRGCDIGLVGYQTTLLVERAGTVLTPDLVAELKQEMLGVMSNQVQVRAGHDFVRPFIMTGGRTRADQRNLRVETMLASVVDMSSDLGSQLPSEQHDLLRVCQEPLSVAEVAVRLQLVVGVVAVIAGDLIAAGLLDVHHTDPVEIELDMLTKMIQRVRAI